MTDCIHRIAKGIIITMKIENITLEEAAKIKEYFDVLKAERDKKTIPLADQTPDCY